MRNKQNRRKDFRVGIDAYSLKPLGLSPFAVLDWAAANGAEGVQFSEVSFPALRSLDKSFLKDLSQCASEKGLYLEWGGGEHIPFDPASGKPKDITAINRRAAEQARRLGVTVVRSCSGGLMRWTEEAPPTEVFLRAMAESLRAQKRMLNDLGVILALETHFEFTTFELRRLFEICGAEPGDYLGICLDTMNLLTMLEDPVRAAGRILPWVVMTHIKDGAVELTDKGLVSFPVEAGTGVIDFKAIFGDLARLGRTINLSLEDHGGDFLIPIFEPNFLLKFPDLTVAEFSGLLRHAQRTRGLLSQGKIAVLERTRWGDHCQDRLRRDIHKIKEIAGRLDV